ncbi:hypothetical protein BKA82DRAFT_4016258 [Pisolithus tinctorius]|nr:hypothetical protein BKA82DRAFT_4016258 [Pisolithus tinctorius]
MSTNVNEVYLGKTGKNQHKEYYGQQTMHGDAEKLHGWDLLTNGGILMYPHHDADGLSTYVTVRSGSKIWCFINSPGSSQLPKEQLFKAWDGIFRDNIKLGFMEYNVATVVLERGDMLIQPPGAYYMVFTPQDSLTSGGHFLSYSSFHLAQLAIQYDCSKCEDGETESGELSTNVVHPSIHHYITQMVLELPEMAQSARAIGGSHIMGTQLPCASHGTNRYHVKRDHQGTREAQKVIQALKAILKVQNAAEGLEVGPWWDPGPVCDISGLSDGSIL